MKKYHVLIVEGLTYKQFSGDIEAKSAEAAREIARQIFLTEHPVYSAHMRIVWCDEIINSYDRGMEG